ncbi:MAG: NTP transferase domain-containing protein [Niastella sp.]|nr:NTP transferase domain-containing protein [Niastella sp.]
MKAMILAAGLGTRLKPWTDNHPKALAPVNGKSLLQRNIEYLQQFDIYDVVVNVHHFASQIADVINKNKGWGSRITISDETNEVLETGGGLKKASSYFSSSPNPFLLMNVDILTNLNLHKLLQAHHTENAMATLAVSSRQTSRYLLFNKENLLCGWHNDKTGETKGVAGNKKAFSGIHIISPDIFPLITETGKFSILDVYLRICNTQPILGYDHSGDLLQDVGKPESIVEAEKKFN